MPDFLHQMTFTVMTHSGKVMTVVATDVNGHMMVMIPADQATDYLHQMILRVQ
jgi:hypothetical protein